MARGERRRGSLSLCVATLAFLSMGAFDDRGEARSGERASGDAAWQIRALLHRLEVFPRGLDAPGPAVTPADGRSAATPHDYDVLHYEIELTPTMAGTRLDGTTRITIQSEVNALAGVLLHLRALTVSQASIGGTTLPFSHVGEELMLTLDRPYAAGEIFVIEIVYGGVPLHESFGGFWFFADMAFSMGVGIATTPPSMGRYWFPCFDEPQDKATVRALYTAPLGMRAVGNGLLTGTIPASGGRTTFIWEDNHPTSTYLIATAFADWRIVVDPVDPARIYHYVLPGDSVNAVTSFQNVSQMMAAYETAYGPYQWDKLSFVGVRRGDMEHSTCIAHLRSLINGTNFYDPILAHELSHHWWGDWVTVADWRDVWLSEGFATFSEAIYQEHIAGPAGYHASMNGIMDYYLASGETFPIYDPEALWGATSYEKGGSVLHMLRHVVGDPDFFAILDAWGAAYGFANAVTTDFTALAESVTGQDLDWYFDEWVYSPGYPLYEWSWLATPSGNQYEVQIHVDQTQTIGPVFRMPVDFAITTASGTTTATEIIDQASQDLSILVAEEPLEVAFDPDRWVLCRKTEMEVGVPEVPGAPVLALGPAAPNPFSPSTSVRLLVGDALLPVNAFVYDGAGRRVRSLLSGSTGENEIVLEWDGLDDGGRALASGLYFLGVEQGGRATTTRLILLH